METDLILKIIDARLQKLGMSQTAAEKAAGTPDAIRNLRRGKSRSSNLSTLDALTSVLELPPNWYLADSMEDLQSFEVTARPIPQDLPFIPILGRVAAGQWAEIAASEETMAERQPSRFPPDPRYPISAQFDLVVEGTSINKFAQPGEMLRCVDLIETGLEIYHNDLVIVERIRSSELRETTAKRVRRSNGRFELWPESTDPRWQDPVIVSPGGQDQHDEIRIIAKVLYAYRTP